MKYSTKVRFVKKKFLISFIFLPLSVCPSVGYFQVQDKDDGYALEQYFSSSAQGTFTNSS